MLLINYATSSICYGDRVDFKILQSKELRTSLLSQELDFSQLNGISVTAIEQILIKRMNCIFIIQFQEKI